MLNTYCYSCHSGASPASMLDLSAYDTTAKIVIAVFDHWEHVHAGSSAATCHPAAPRSRPRRSGVVGRAGSRRVSNHEAERNAGDPGLVLARRLSNAEFDYTVQDLTGIDVSAPSHFPVDPANEAGFDNSGETTRGITGTAGKYLDAARNLADHVVFTPRGFSFAPHVAVTDPDWDRYVVNRIMAFYQRQPTDLRRLLRGAVAVREPLGARARRRLAGDHRGQGQASRRATSSSYAASCRTAQARSGRWRACTSLGRDACGDARPDEATSEARPRSCAITWSPTGKLAWTFDVPRAPPLQIVSQPLVMHVNRQGAAHHRILNPQVLIPADTANPAAKGYDRDLVIPAEGAARAAGDRALEGSATCSRPPSSSRSGPRPGSPASDGASAQRRLPQRDGLFPRRPSALRPDPG